MEPAEIIARAIYDAPTTLDGDAIATHLANSFVIDASARTRDNREAVVRSVCMDAAQAALKALEDAGMIPLRKDDAVLLPVGEHMVVKDG